MTPLLVVFPALSPSHVFHALHRTFRHEPNRRTYGNRKLYYYKFALADSSTDILLPHILRFSAHVLVFFWFLQSWSSLLVHHPPIHSCPLMRLGTSPPLVVCSQSFTTIRYPCNHSRSSICDALSVRRHSLGLVVGVISHSFPSFFQTTLLGIL